jgi:hypothetical protein
LNEERKQERVPQETAKRLRIAVISEDDARHVLGAGRSGLYEPEKPK